MTTSLVTGASGFVGSAVARRLAAAGHRVRVLARPTSDLRNLEGLDVEVVLGDLLDPPSLRRAVEGCDALFHAAADYRLWVPDAERMIATNVDGTRALMLAALDAGVGRVVYTSSVAALGYRPDGEPADERTTVSLDAMVGTYKRSKYLAEQAVLELVEARGLPAVIVNPSSPMGPRDVKPTPTGRIVIDAACGRMPAFVDTGLNVVHVEDVAEGHLLAFARGAVGERYVLGGENLTLREILVRVAELVGRSPPGLRIPHGAALAFAHASEAWARLRGREPMATVDGVRMARRKMFFSSAKAARELGYAPRPAQEALRDAVRWFGENGYLD
ncbi:MAG: SDR family NAD(P)-dependent oxidoreductase [Gemmatimonadetes bacterium]|nr:MAG: SDR family NAD(P)-dependent oxidoreductase [Gemmatimonadota bacterium]